MQAICSFLPVSLVERKELICWGVIDNVILFVCNLKYNIKKYSLLIILFYYYKWKNMIWLLLSLLVIP
jgi:hypothetical protein